MAEDVEGGGWGVAQIWRSFDEMPLIQHYQFCFVFVNGVEVRIVEGIYVAHNTMIEGFFWGGGGSSVRSAAAGPELKSEAVCFQNDL